MFYKQAVIMKRPPRAGLPCATLMDGLLEEGRMVLGCVRAASSWKREVKLADSAEEEPEDDRMVEG